MVGNGERGLVPTKGAGLLIASQTGDCWGQGMCCWSAPELVDQKVIIHEMEINQNPPGRTSGVRDWGLRGWVP